MAEYFSSRELNLVSRTAVTATQSLNGVGVARALQLKAEGRIAYVESGEGATSEGEFFEPLNWASREKLPSQALAYVKPEAIAACRKEKPVNTFWFGNQKITTKVYMMAPAEAEEIRIDVADYTWEGDDELVPQAL